VTVPLPPRSSSQYALPLASTAKGTRSLKESTPSSPPCCGTLELLGFGLIARSMRSEMSQHSRRSSHSTLNTLTRSTGGRTAYSTASSPFGGLKRSSPAALPFQKSLILPASIGTHDSLVILVLGCSAWRKAMWISWRSSLSGPWMMLLSSSPAVKSESPSSSLNTPRKFRTAAISQRPLMFFLSACVSTACWFPSESSSSSEPVPSSAVGARTLLALGSEGPRWGSWLPSPSRPLSGEEDRALL